MSKCCNDGCACREIARARQPGYIPPRTHVMPVLDEPDEPPPSAAPDTDLMREVRENVKRLNRDRPTQGGPHSEDDF